MKPPGIYQLIEEALLMSESPLTCDDLFDRAEIKALAPSAPPDCRVSTDGPNVIIEVDDLKITIQRK